MDNENFIEKPIKKAVAVLEKDKKTEARKSRLTKNLKQNLKRRKNKDIKE